MRVRPNHLLSLILIVLAGCGGAHKSVKKTASDPRWVPIDSLAAIGQYASALEKVVELRDAAAASGDQHTEFGAWMRWSRYERMVGTEPVDILREIGTRAESAPVPLAQLLHSARAEGWWNHYASERWSILERTELGGPGGDDPATWTQQRFMAEIIAAYEASLAHADTLKQLPVGELDALLEGDVATRSLRPTVYDVLAHRALATYTNKETRITEPAWRFQLNDASWFELFHGFTHRKLVHRDSTAWEFKAMQLFQSLERLHLNDDKLDAHVDVVLQRLAYVRAHSTLANKDSLYLGALELLRTRLPLDACEAEVMVAMARLHEELGNGHDRLVPGTLAGERRRALELCDSALMKWPSSFGARNAEALKAGLQRVALELQVEQAVVPEKPFRAAVRYTNADTVWLRVVKDPFELNKLDRYDRDHGAELAGQPVVRAWSIAVPDDGDLNEHVVEIPMEGLPLGRYAILISGAEGFRVGADVMAWCPLQVTDMAMLQRQTGTELDLLVLDRTTGRPMADVKARAYVRNPDHTGVERFIGVADMVTDADGMVRTNLAGRQGEVRWSLERGADRFMCSPLWVYTSQEGEPDGLRGFLFTDRAIYRPGQEIFFKGIVTTGRKAAQQVKPGHTSTIRLFDANGELVDSLAVTTDAFGAFQGRFKLPLGGLTGSASLRTDLAQKDVLVEEYKRPRFEVTFPGNDTIPKLGEQVTVHGSAKSYAGAPLDGAQVRYTVKRTANMPWWCGWNWRGGPWGRSTEVASGETTCDATGGFRVQFIAQADQAIAREADPSFSYTVEAWVTDVNGETQTASTSRTVGYRTIDVAVLVSEALDRSIADSLRVRVTDLSGQAMAVPLEVTLSRLARPLGGVKRPRQWDRPDRFVLTKAEHDARFAGDVYDNEGDPEAWTAVGTPAPLFTGAAHEGAIPIKGIQDLEVGTYRIDARAQDPSGRWLEVHRIITFYDPHIQNTGFENEAFHVQVVNGRCAPGEKAVLLLSSALPECRVLMEVEREAGIVVRRPFVLRAGQQRVEIPVLDTDRGDFTVHFVAVVNGMDLSRSVHVDVPWSNKELQVEWTRFRDKLLPGSKEEWRVRITGPAKEKVAAQVLAAMYDASLDQFATPSWAMPLWEANQPRRGWARQEPFGVVGTQQIGHTMGWVADSTRDYLRLTGDDMDLLGLGGRRVFRTLFSPALGDAEGASDGVFATTTGAYAGENGLVREGTWKDLGDARTQATTGGESTPMLRTDFRETAFFFPDLLTDRDGSVVLRFTMPDALTRWNFLGLAHTKDLGTALFSRSTVTQKPIMVVPNLPRFLRQGDRITLTAKINVLEGNAVSGTARLELFDPYTNKSINGTFGVVRPDRTFSAARGRSPVVAWEVSVPEGVDAVAVRITANAAQGGDGEEQVLPILTDKVLVTESVPLWMNKAGKKDFVLPGLVASANSGTLRHRSVTLEYTPNPAWYAVQALPYLMEFPHECAEQLFSRYYANHLAAHIVAQRPAIKKVFQAWSKGAPGNEGAFLSALEKNPELKGVLLEETPWVMTAKEEGDRKRRIALLFDLHRMAEQEAATLGKLRDMQLADGSWPWWSGMQPSRTITQHIVAGFGHLQQLGALELDPDSDPRRMMQRAVQWLDGAVAEEYERRLREAKEGASYRPSYEEVHYLYARSCFPQIAMEKGTRKAADFLLAQVRTHWLDYGLQEQAMIAIALHRMTEGDVPVLITTSLAQRATLSDELGMYWKGARAGYAWNEMPTETHALMIEAFGLITRDQEKVGALRRHLLSLKRTTDWRTTKATADACYALLLTGDDQLGAKEAPSIRLGGVPVKRTNGAATEAGTGYFEERWTGDAVRPAMGNISITTTTDGEQWGALHWQYFEQMDKVAAHESPFSIRREVLRKEATDDGARLMKLDEGDALAPGDKLTVRIELRTDRPLDMVHLKDLHASGTDATRALSGYQWQGGLGYYMSIRDASMHFFFDRIVPGTYVLEYDLKVTHAGSFSHGIAEAACMYAPEFSSHSQGLRLRVGTDR